MKLARRLGCIIAGISLFVVSDAHAQQPNIVLIMLDDLGVGELQWYPSESDISTRSADPLDTIQTPALFNLAKQGLRFTNYYSPSSVCSPSRAAILTGRFPQEFGFRDYLPFDSGRGLPARTPTIASLLGESGAYTTAHFGKWHLGDSAPHFLPPNYGFDQSFARYGNEVLSGYMGSTFIEGDDLAGKSVVAPDEHSAATITDRAQAFITAAEESDKPYFLNLWYRATHKPLDPPANFPAVVPGDDNPVTASAWPSNWSDFVSAIPELEALAYLENHSLTADAKRRAMYIASIAWVDYQIGRLIEHIDALDPDGNTIVVVTTDNGAIAKAYADAESDEVPGGWMPNGDLSGFKGTTFEGGIRTPLIVRWPTNPAIIGGSVMSELTVGYDFLPTFLDAASVEFDAANFVGRSFLNALSGSGPLPARAEPLIWEVKRFSSFWNGTDLNTSLDDEQNNYALLDPSIARKLTVSDSLNGVAETYTRLYEASIAGVYGVDEAEDNNLADAEAEVVETLEANYRYWRRQVGQISHVFDLEASTAGMGDACLDISRPTEVAVVQEDEDFRFREGDFSFQARVELDELPDVAAVTVAEHPDSWSLTAQKTINADEIKLKLNVFGKDTEIGGHPGVAGDRITLVAFADCALPCGLNLAFTLLGIADAESSVRLYVDGLPVNEYRGNSRDGPEFREVFASESASVLIGNNAAGTSGMRGRVIDPVFFRSNLTPDEISSIMFEQAGVVCDAGCH